MSIKSETLSLLIKQGMGIMGHLLGIASILALPSGIAPINAHIFKRTSKINEPCTGHMITVKSASVEGTAGGNPVIVFDVYDDMTEETVKRPMDYFTFDELLYLVQTIQIEGYDPRED